MSSAFPKLKDTRKKPDKGESRNVRTMSTPKVKVDNPKGKGKISLPKKYVPKSLSAADKKKHVKSIVEGKKRPKVESFKSKRSTHAMACIHGEGVGRAGSGTAAGHVWRFREAYVSDFPSRIMV